MAKIILALGGNVGNVVNTFAHAERQIEKSIGTISRRSSLYRTEPWGNKEQDDFLNGVIIADTSLSADDALKEILCIEIELGRQRKKDDQYAPRTVDIDILFYNNEIIHTNDLTIPHSKLHLRNFVLAPLSEVAPELIHPVFHETMWQLFQNTKDTSVVNKL